MKLTEKQIRHWIAEGVPLAGRSDGGGLTFTMSAKQAGRGEGSWVLRYRMDGRQREVTLGGYPGLTLKAARALAVDQRLHVCAGWDVAAEKQFDRQARKAGQRAAVLRRQVARLEAELNELEKQAERVGIQLDSARKLLDLELAGGGTWES